MIESIFKFNDTKSKDIMTSRKDTFSINIDDDIEENIDKYADLYVRGMKEMRESLEKMNV